MPHPLWLLACTGAPTPAPDTSAAPTDTADTADTGAIDSAEPFSCGEVGAPPDLESGTWSRAGSIAAGDVVTVTAAPGGFPVYLGGLATGMFNAKDDSFDWHALPVDKGHTWGDMPILPEDPLTIFRSNGGVLARSRDGGMSWELGLLGSVGDPEHPEAQVMIIGAAADAEAVYAFDMQGRVYASGDLGDTWTERGTIPLTAPGEAGRGGFVPFATRLFPGDRFLLAVGDMLYASDDDLESWTILRDDLAGGRAVAREGEIVVAATDDGWVRSLDAGESWSEGDPSFPVTAVALAEDGVVAVGASDRLHVLGADRALPAAPEALAWAGDTLLLFHDEGIYASDDHGDSWRDVSDGVHDDGITVAVPHPVCDDRVLIGSRCGGGVHTSGDHATTWTHTDQFFHYVMDVVFDPADPTRLWGVSDDVLLRSDDEGMTWEEVVRDYHYHGFAVNPDDPDTLLLGSVGSGEYADEKGTVYRSTDGGAAWEDVGGSFPDNASSAHAILYWPDDPGVVLCGFYKGGDVAHLSGEGIGLWRSMDGGTSWEKSSLPTNDIAWLVEEDGVVWAATGEGVWWSSDRGESWTDAGVEGWFLGADFRGATGLAYRSDGTVLRSDDAGASWKEWTTGLPFAGGTALARVAISADGTVAYATPYGQGAWRRAM